MARDRRDHLPDGSLETDANMLQGEMGKQRSSRGVSPRGVARLLAVLVVVVAAAFAGLAISAAIQRGRGGPANQGGAAAPATAQFSEAGLHLSYPASWSARTVDLPLHYENVMAYVGSGSGTMTCGSDFIPGLGGTCAEQFDLSPDTVVLKVTRASGPPSPDGPVAWSLANDPGVAPTTIAGQPGTVQTLDQPPSGVDSAVMWIFTNPSDPLGSYRITAYMRGPDVASLRAQVEAVLKTASIGP